MTQQIALRISDELAEQLDIAAQGYPSRSVALRIAIEEFVLRSQRELLEKSLVDAYKRVPAGEIDEWGSIERASAILSVISARTLDDEDGGW
jgi:predicted transcriptional regulator